MCDWSNQFQFYLYEHHFTLMTDHKLLLILFKRVMHYLSKQLIVLNVGHGG